MAKAINRQWPLESMKAVVAWKARLRSALPATRALVAGAPVSVVAAVATEALSPGALLSLALVPALIGLARAGRHLANAELNALLAATARYGTLFCLALAVGVAA